MNGAELSRALREGRTVYGTLVVSPSPLWPAWMKTCGLDFVFIDTEHIPLDRHQVAWMCQAFSAQGLAPIVRIAEPSPGLACQFMDGGAAGIIAPYVESAGQARDLAGALKCRPIKGQRLAAAGCDPASFATPLRDYVRGYEKNGLLIVNIESGPALAALDEIVRVPGLDGVLIGPHDLSCSLGVPEQYEHPELLGAVSRILATARAAGIGAGIHYWGEPEQMARWAREGANFLIHSGDITLFTKHLRHEVAELRRLTGGDRRGPDPVSSAAV